LKEERRSSRFSIDGPSIVMYMEGKIDGNGMLIPGNPNGF
jgi:hypothetical protein